MFNKTPASVPEASIINENGADVNKSTKEDGSVDSNTKSIFSGAILNFNISSKKSDKSDEEGPRDNYHFVYWSVFVIGIVCMLPWDMLVSVSDYWHYKFRNASLDALPRVRANVSAMHSVVLTKRQKEFESYIAIAGSVPSAVVVLTHAFVGAKFTVHGRAHLALIGMILTFAAIIALAYLDSDEWETLFLISNLTLAVIINSFRALFRATNGANMGKFPVRYMGALANGVCMGGLLPVLVNLAILSMDVELQMVGFYCFVVSALLACLALLLFRSVETTPFYVHFASQKASKEVSFLSKSLLSTVWQNSGLYLLTASITTITTALIYPAAASLVRPAVPSTSDWHLVYFTQVSCFLVFNIGNNLGTMVAGLIQWPSDTLVTSQVTLLLLAILRLVMVPTLMTCNLAPSDRDSIVFLDSDTAFIVLLALFAISDGYLVNMSQMFAPKAGCVEHQELTGGIMVACLACSLTMGSIMSNLVVKAL